MSWSWSWRLPCNGNQALLTAHWPASSANFDLSVQLVVTWIWHVIDIDKLSNELRFGPCGKVKYVSARLLHQTSGLPYANERLISVGQNQLVRMHTNPLTEHAIDSAKGLTCIMCVQYIGGCSVHRGVFSTSGGYHEYIGGIS